MKAYTRFLEQTAGALPVDTRIDNAKVVDVFSGKVFNSSVCIAQGKIAGFTALPAGESFDAQGRYLLPGLIDSHVHIESSMLCPAEFARAVLPRGTTTVIADPHEIANVKGMSGIRYMLEATELPLDVRITLSSCVPALPFEEAGASLTAGDIASLLSAPRVVGLGEMMNTPGVLNRDPDVLHKIHATLMAGKIVDGHAPGLSGPSLDAYIAAGISTDHESAAVAELEKKIQRGMYVLLREGSASHDLLKLVPGVTPANASRCLFCTDDRSPVDIIRTGHIDNHLRLAVGAGLDPILAVRMATLNAAQCYKLTGKGGIAPGWLADLILVDDLRSFNVSHVWCKGELTAQNGRLLKTLPCLPPGELTGSVNVPPLPPEAFSLHIPSGRARVIQLAPGSLLTRCDVQTVQTTEGWFNFAMNPGLLKLAVIERHKGTGKTGLGLLDRNYGLRGGAIATTVSHDSHNIVVVGDNDPDMRQAVEEVSKLGGGIVMIGSGDVLASLPLPVGGLMSENSAGAVAASLEQMYDLASRHYHIWDQADSFMTLSFLALPVIPHLKLTPNGLFDVDQFEFVSVDAG